MSNVYVYDFVFIVLYMLNKGLGCRFKRRHVEWFPEFSGYFFWVECCIMLLYIYVRPEHTDSENMVSFAIMVSTIAAWSITVIRLKLNG